MTTSLFAYGTLEIPQVMRAVTGRTFRATPAVLPKYARYLLQGRIYPGIVRDFRSEVSGMLYADVDDDSLALLDRFEGDFYRRENVRVRTDAERWEDAVSYVVPSDRRLLLTNLPWDRAAFVAQHLDDFLPYCLDFRSSQARRPEIESPPR
jgi:gamma-glutamylcyclotransferase (GGCT)/AIG2-like uncharacterized protein YtfP